MDGLLLVVVGPSSQFALFFFFFSLSSITNSPTSLPPVRVCVRVCVLCWLLGVDASHSHFAARPVNLQHKRISPYEKVENQPLESRVLCGKGIVVSKDIIDSDREPPPLSIHRSTDMVERKQSYNSRETH